MSRWTPADADRGSEVEDHIDVTQSPIHCGGIGDVADHQFGIPIEIIRHPPRGAVNLRREIIQNSDIVTGCEKDIRSMGADEPSSACNENSRH